MASGPAFHFCWKAGPLRAAKPTAATDKKGGTVSIVYCRGKSSPVLCQHGCGVWIQHQFEMACVANQRMGAAS